MGQQSTAGLLHFYKVVVFLHSEKSNRFQWKEKNPNPSTTMNNDPDYPDLVDRGLTKAEQKELKDGEPLWCKLLVSLALGGIITIFGIGFGFWQLARWLSLKH